MLHCPPLQRSEEWDFSRTTSISRLERLQSFDADAWHRMTESYQPQIQSWALRAGLNVHDAADVVQEVFTAVAAHLDRFRRENDQHTFRGWVRRITQNKIRDHYRRAGRDIASLGGSSAYRHLQNLSDVCYDDDASAAFDPKASAIVKVLKRVQVEFRSNTWEAFWRAAVENENAASIGEDLQMSTAAVHMAKSRVKRRLREELEPMALATGLADPQVIRAAPEVDETRR